MGFLDVSKSPNFCRVKPSSIRRQRKPNRKPNQKPEQEQKPNPVLFHAPEGEWDGECKNPLWPIPLCCAARRFGNDGYKKCVPCRFSPVFSRFLPSFNQYCVRTYTFTDLKGRKECEKTPNNHLVCCEKYEIRVCVKQQRDKCPIANKKNSQSDALGVVLQTFQIRRESIREKRRMTNPRVWKEEEEAEEFRKKHLFQLCSHPEPKIPVSPPATIFTLATVRKARLDVLSFFGNR